MVDIISKLGLQKSSVVQHMTSVIQPLLEKGIVGHSIVHKALVEYFTIVDMVIFECLLIKQHLNAAYLSTKEALLLLG